MIAEALLYVPLGLAIGLGSTAPVGPVNLIVMQRALAGQRRAALSIGVGAALADTLFALAAAFGLGALSIAIDRHDQLLRIAGGVILIGFAVFVWRSAPHLETAATPAPRRSHLLALGMTMALTNPANVLFFITSFSAIGIAGLGLDSAQHRANSLLVAAGVAAGAMGWWLFITALASRLRGRLSDAVLRWLNIGTAVLLALSGGAALFAGVFSR